MSYAKFGYDLNEYLVNCKKSNIPTDNCEAIVRDKWISEKRYKELIAFIIENWDSGNCDDFSRPLSKHLIDNNELQLFKLLWKGIIRNRLEKLWGHYDYVKKLLPNLTVEKIKNVDIKGFNQFSSKETAERRVAWERQYVIEGINEFITGLKILGDIEEIEKQDTLLTIVSNLDKPKPKPTTDKRKIDENLFWQLIDHSRKISTDQFSFLDNLKSLLEGFSPKELRNFDKILKLKANELNSWEHWALAYIARRGCGDDEFDYFKVWAVSKGQKAFNSIKNIDEKELVSIFNEDPQLEELYFLAEQLYEDKTFDFMTPVKIKVNKLTGKKWEENDLQKKFPTICKLFNYEL
ncbi:MAG: DUF4240 domain-containing protein [Bacteroidia bacterium]|jgi:hypothetical protein